MSKLSPNTRDVTRSNGTNVSLVHIGCILRAVELRTGLQQTLQADIYEICDSRSVEMPMLVFWVTTRVAKYSEIISGHVALSGESRDKQK
jgi:hypothetical protein